MSENTTQPEEITFKDTALKIYRVLDFLLRNSEGISLEDIAREFNITIDGVRSTIGRLRNKKGYNFILANKIVRTRVKNRKPKPEDIIENIQNANNDTNNVGKNFHKEYKTENQIEASEAYQQIIDILKTNPAGITTEDLTEKLQIEKQRLYNLCYALRKKGYNISFANNHYTLQSGTPKIQSQKNRHPKKGKYNYKYNDGEITQVAPVKNQLIPPEYKEAFENLPDTDKVECIKLMKKSVYYYKSALSLMESNQLAYNLLSNIQGISL